MRLPVRLSLLVVLLGGPLCDSPTAQVTATVPAVATVHARTSLVVSSRLLSFEVGQAEGTASDGVDFSAGTRTAPGADVVLSVEPLGGVSGPGGAADVDTSIAFAGSGDGTVAGELRAVEPTIAARWTGSGLRRGRLVFTLRAGAPGTYQLAVRFVLSAP